MAGKHQRYLTTLTDDVWFEDSTSDLTEYHSYEETLAWDSIQSWLFWVETAILNFRTEDVQFFTSCILFLN